MGTGLGESWPGLLTPPWRGEVCWLSADRSCLPCACSWIQWILTSPSCNALGETDGYWKALVTSRGTTSSLGCVRDDVLGVLTSGVSQWVWCIPPSVSGKLMHVVLTWTFQKGKQSWSLPVKSIPVILKLSRSQPFAKPMKATDPICPLTVGVHVPTACDTVHQDIPPHPTFPPWLSTAFSAIFR